MARRRRTARRGPAHRRPAAPRHSRAPGSRRGREWRDVRAGGVGRVLSIEAAADVAPRGLTQPLDLAGPVVEGAQWIGECGPAADRGEHPCDSRSTQPRSAAALAARSSPISSASATASGTTRFAASVGVAARTSATWSISGESGSCPIADTIGVRASTIARHSASSENGSRSSTLPPPRARMITSTAGRRRVRRGRSGSAEPRYAPCTAVLRISNRTAGQRRWATARTSRSAALARPVISPMVPGRNGSGRFSRGSNSPSAASSARSRSMRASSSPSPTARISVTRNESAAASREERPFAEHHHAAALGERDGGFGAAARGAGHRQRHVHGRITQHQERGAGSRTDIDLGDLALDPDRAESVDPLCDLGRDGPDRPGLLGGSPDWSRGSELTWPWRR